jgi:hypothetical protein
MDLVSAELPAKTLIVAIGSGKVNHRVPLEWLRLFPSRCSPLRVIVVPGTGVLLSVGHRSRPPIPPRVGQREYRFAASKSLASVPGPGALARRRGHLLMSLANVAPAPQESEAESPAIAGNPFVSA